MSPIQKSAAILQRELSDQLGLEDVSQDWGIVNANGARLDEFVSLFGHGNLEPTQRFVLAGLILASANDRLLQGLPVKWEPLISLAEQDKGAFEHHIDYWSALSDDDEFPLSIALRKARQSQRPTVETRELQVRDVVEQPDGKAWLDEPTD